MTIAQRRFAAAAGLGLMMLLVGCGGGASPSSDAAAGDGNVVRVTLQEWSVLATPDGASAGEVTFQVTNEGPDDVHEFVVIRTELNPTELPFLLTGQVDETAAGITVITEIEDIPVGETREVTATLNSGPYVLLCNIYSESEQEAHYQMGMRLPFPVD